MLGSITCVFFMRQPFLLFPYSFFFYFLHGIAAISRFV